MQGPWRRLRSPPCRRKERRWFDRGRLSLVDGHADSVLLGVGAGTSARQGACLGTRELGASWADSPHGGSGRMSEGGAMDWRDNPKRTNSTIYAPAITRRLFNDYRKAEISCRLSDRHGGARDAGGAYFRGGSQDYAWRLFC